MERLWTTVEPLTEAIISFICGCCCIFVILGFSVFSSRSCKMFYFYVFWTYFCWTMVILRVVTQISFPLCCIFSIYWLPCYSHSCRWCSWGKTTFHTGAERKNKVKVVRGETDLIVCLVIWRYSSVIFFKKILDEKNFQIPRRDILWFLNNPSVFLRLYCRYWKYLFRFRSSLIMSLKHNEKANLIQIIDEIVFLRTPTSVSFCPTEWGEVQWNKWYF